MQTRLKLLLTSLLLCTALFVSAVSCTLPIPPTTNPIASTVAPIGQTSVATDVPSITEAPVVKVIDGDTIDVNINAITRRVRYIGIDTPERDTPFYTEATNANSELVAGKTIRLVKDTRDVDDYGRLLRYVYVGEIFVNARLVELGWATAFPYPPDVQYKTVFADLEQIARSKYLGIWSTKYSGNKSSKKYHFPDCYYAKQISAENYIGFTSAAEAVSNGYTPCGVCKPPTVD